MKRNPKKFQFMILGKGTRFTVILNITRKNKGITKSNFIRYQNR